MKKAKMDLPLLKDVVIPGKEVPTKEELPPILNELQVKALQQQIEQIIQTQLEETLKKVTQETVQKIKVHLNKKLPQLLKEMNKTSHDGM